MKTLNQKLQAGYKLPTVLDEATKELIKAWFGRRYCPANFDAFFKRAVELHYPYYKEQLRVDPSVANYDWFVEQYLEKAADIKTTNQASDIKTQTGTTNNNNSTTRNSNGSNSSNGSSESANKESSRNSTQQRNNPMSASYGGGSQIIRPGQLNVGGQLSAGMNDDTGFFGPMISNPTATGDEMGQGASVSRDINNDSSSYNDHSVDSSNGSTSRNLKDETSKFDNGVTTNREIQTGRHQLPASVIGGAMACIQSSESWNWFYKQLDKCFMLIYNIDEDDDIDDYE